jgi:hypothetical protein
MKVRTGVLAALALAVFTDAGHADPDQPAPSLSDRPVSADGVKSNDGQPGPGSTAGSAAETTAGHQPAVKPAPGDPVRGSMWDTPIDTRITVNQGRAANKGPKGIGVAVKAIAQRLQNKSRTATATGVTIHHDAHQQHQKPAQTSVSSGAGSPRRNAIGASIEPRTAAGHDAPSPAGHAAQQSPVLQGASRPPAGVPAATSAAVTAPVPAMDRNNAAQPVNRPDAAAHGLIAMSASGPTISGTAMIRPGAGTGAIGGPAKVATGVISGANVRMRHR